MSNQRLMKAKEKAGDGYAKTNAIGGGVKIPQMPASFGPAPACTDRDAADSLSVLVGACLSEMFYE